MIAIMNPKALNYSMPPEWAPHTRTFLSWPIQASMVYPDDYEAVCQGYAEIAKAIAEFEPVTLIVNPTDSDHVRSFFTGITNVELLPIPHNDAWFRDNGPTFVVDGKGGIAGVNWR